MSIDCFFSSLPGLVQKIDQRLPVANEYLLLSGGAREGVLDLNPEDLGNYAKGADFDLDFTLLVPALKLHDRNQPVSLDMRHSTPCHTWLSLHLCDSKVLSRWSICCQEESSPCPEEEEEGDTGMLMWDSVKRNDRRSRNRKEFEGSVEEEVTLVLFFH